MKKNDIIKIMVVLVVLGFITETFYFGGHVPTVGPSQQEGGNITGTAVFNGTIRTYDPRLLVQGALPQPVIDQLNTRKEVRGIQQDSGITIINLDSRDSVFPVAGFLRSLNVTAYAVANIIVDQQLQFTTISGTVGAYLPNGVLQVATQPFVDADTQVPVQLVAVLQNGQVISYQQATLLINDVNLTSDAKIDSLNRTTYSYTIPWEKRNSIDPSLYNSSYQKVDSVVFTTPLAVGQVVSFRALPFIIYIDANSAQVESSFDNVTQFNQSFQGIAYILPPSTLTIVSNTTPSLPFTPAIGYTYNILLENSSYSFPQDSLQVDSSAVYQPGADANLTMEAVVLGNQVLEIKRVSLPS